ncbi:MAG TPA: helix-turn-helix domain-containing protein [Burkholderiaceae bacterium]|nr:helix-turn-helix domain-containing protein [Burkholderiaceae bacterium]
MQDGAGAGGGPEKVDTQGPNTQPPGVTILVVSAGDLDAARLAQHLRETCGAVVRVTLVVTGECTARTPDGTAVDYVATSARILNQLAPSTSVQQAHSSRADAAPCVCRCAHDELGRSASAVAVEPANEVMREEHTPARVHCGSAPYLACDREPHHDETGTDLDATRSLTRREREIVELLRQGFTNKEIGRQLGIMEDTVKKHLQAVFGKLGVHRRALVVLRRSSGQFF